MAIATITGPKYGIELKTPAALLSMAFLPADEFPSLVECAVPFTTVDPDFHYKFGIDLFIAGVKALAPPS